MSAYCGLIIYVLHHWYNTPTTFEYSIPEAHPKNQAHITVIIPARNEANNIKQCIESILANSEIENYKPEIIVVDDHSTDATATIVSDINHPYVQLLSLQDHIQPSEKINAYKKAAINLGIQKASNQLILQLDADVIVPQEFLSTINLFISRHPIEFVAGPVKMSECRTLLHHFQQLDILGMMAVTAAGIHSKKWYMANGANMLYNKRHVTYDAQAIASGDDIYTIQLVAEEYSDSVFFMKNKNAIVTTDAMHSYASLYSQRIRWATKNKSMPNLWMQLMMLIPFLNAVILISHFAMIYFFGKAAIMIFLFHLMTKMAADYILLSEMTDYYGERRSMRYFVPCNLMHVLYISAVGVMSLFVKKYTWKSRKVY